MILENTIIENKKGYFMGKMILDDLRKRLERLDEDADLMIDNFPYNFQDRLQPLPFDGTKVQFYTPSLEDFVIAKLCSFRDTDKADVQSEAVRNSLDWDLLEHLATDEDELRASILNDWRYRDFYIRYQAYVERWRPCEN